MRDHDGSKTALNLDTKSSNQCNVHRIKDAGVKIYPLSTVSATKKLPAAVLP